MPEPLGTPCWRIANRSGPYPFSYHAARESATAQIDVFMPPRIVTEGVFLSTTPEAVAATREALNGLGTAGLNGLHVWEIVNAGEGQRSAIEVDAVDAVMRLLGLTGGGDGE